MRASLRSERQDLPDVGPTPWTRQPARRNREPVPAIVAALLGLLLSGPGTVVAATAIDWLTIDGGGIMGAGGAGLSLSGTVGQPDAGTLTGGRWTLSGGFWLGGQAVAAVPGGEPGTGGSKISVFRLALPAPNPVVTGARLHFELPAPGFATLRIHDVRGRQVRTLLSQELPAGGFDLPWDGADDRGAPVPAGIYFLGLEAGPRRAGQKIVVAR